MNFAYYLKYRGTRFPVRVSETTLGRSADCPIVLSNPLASRQHAKVVLKSGGVLEIVDLGSSNGTRVNGELITSPRALASGDVISIGSDLLEVELVPNARIGLERVSTDEEEDTDREISFDTETSILTRLQFIETMITNARETRTPTKFTMPIRRAIDQYVATRKKFGRGEALRIASAVEAIRAWCVDGSVDDWYYDTMERIEPFLDRPEPG
jgi:pSer/pThr/pTyr-binding forkhead associated (FHA) protein